MLQEDIVDMLIKYGLFIGAIFQLVCIGAVIIMPDSKSDYFEEATESWSEDEQGGSGSAESCCGSPSPSHSSPSHSNRGGTKSKRDKKKRR